MIFFTADSHFGHTNIIKHDSRPFNNIYEHDIELIKRWNSKVKPNDEVWHLGDFAFRNKNPADWYLKQLNGKINIIWGNHDGKVKKYSHLFNSTQDFAEININNKLIVLFHYPIQSWHSRGRGSWHLHGHCHGKQKTNGKRIDVGVNVNDYCPLSIDEITQMMSLLPQFTSGESDHRIDNNIFETPPPNIASRYQ